MKKLVTLICLLLISAYTLQAQDTLEFQSNQSMCISGKGAGQDGAINPYLGEDCYAIVNNTGDDTFSVRIEEGNRNIVKTIAIKRDELKKVLLKKNQVLYIDTEIVEKAIAEISFEKIEN